MCCQLPIMQVGVGHSFQLHATGWKWKLTTSLGGDGISRIRNKTSLGLCPGVDFRFGWRADYVLPEITGLVIFSRLIVNHRNIFTGLKSLCCDRLKVGDVENEEKI